MGVYFPKKVLKSRPGLISLFILLIMLLLECPVVDFPGIVFVKDAEARIGRPLSPGSIAGVHRRTRRRTRRRWAVGTRMYALPVGYTTAVVAGTTYYIHEGAYYKASYEGNEVVYVVVDDPKEAETDEADAKEAETDEADAKEAETDEADAKDAATDEADAEAQPAQTQPASTGTAEQELLELKSLYDKGLINEQEYEDKKKEVLDSM